MIQEIEISKLKIHPRNVRKTYRGIEELAESIKAKGILQNLTVVPDKDEEGTYLVVIGNRRLTAARMAGIETLPCEVTEMDEKEQASVMLLENIQRDDLTIYEEAQGFQMVLDLGETEDGLAEKTGFSKTTIRRRLNIAKLNQEELQRKEQEEGFQLSLTDLYELEKIKSVSKRDEILKNSDSSRDITARVRSEIAKEKKEEVTKKLVSLAKKNGIEEAPDEVKNQMYSNKWDTIKTYNLSDDAPKTIDIKPEGKEKLYYIKYWSEFRIIRKAKKVKKEQTPEEKKKAEKDSRKKRIKAIAKSMDADRRNFILDIIAGKIAPLKDSEKVCLMCWKIMRESSSWVNNSGFVSFFTGKDSYDASEEERNNAIEQTEKLGIVEQTLIATYCATKDKDFTEWNGDFNKNTGRIFEMFYDVLSQYGFSYGSNEEANIVNGTHELYTETEEE